MTRDVGSWVRCPFSFGHKNLQMMYFRKLNYNYDFCHLCLEALRMRNAKLFGALIPNQTLSQIKHSQYTPEKDTL
jgi:acetyl-CoA carboxylase beta subunit